jgi:hypothetical protein
VPPTSPAAGARAAPVAADTTTDVTRTAKTLERAEPTADRDPTRGWANVGGLAGALGFLIGNRNVLARTFPKPLPHELLTSDWRGSGSRGSAEGDAGSAGGDRYGSESIREPIEVVMAPRAGAGLRSAMGATLRCANEWKAPASVDTSLLGGVSRGDVVARETFPPVREKSSRDATRFRYVIPE